MLMNCRSEDIKLQFRIFQNKFFEPELRKQKKRKECHYFGSVCRCCIFKWQWLKHWILNRKYNFPWDSADPFIFILNRSIYNWRYSKNKLKIDTFIYLAIAEWNGFFNVMQLSIYLILAEGPGVAREQIFEKKNILKKPPATHECPQKISAQSVQPAIDNIYIFLNHIL